MSWLVSSSTGDESVPEGYEVHLTSEAKRPPSQAAVLCYLRFAGGPQGWEQQSSRSVFTGIVPRYRAALLVFCQPNQSIHAHTRSLS